MKYPTPRIGETWLTRAGKPLVVVGLGDTRVARMQRKILVRIGEAEGERNLANFLALNRPAKPAPSLLLECPRPGETWVTEAGTTCVIVDAGDPSLSRRDRRVTIESNRQRRAVRVSCFMYYWTRITHGDDGGSRG